MASMFGAGLRLAPVVAVIAALVTVGCRGTEEGKIGISVVKNVPGIGPVELGFKGGWKAEFGNEELCGCVIFLGPDGNPLKGAAVGEIKNGRGGGPIPEGGDRLASTRHGRGLRPLGLLHRSRAAGGAGCLPVGSCCVAGGANGASEALCPPQLTPP